MITVLFQIILVLLDILWWVILIQAVMSWLIAFNVINTWNDSVRAIWLALQKITEPFYRPIRRILPDFGPLDLSPLVVLLILRIVRTIIVPYLYSVFTGGPVM